MPQHGEIRRGATESVQWDGSKWTPLQSATPQSVDHPVSFGWLDAVPGLRDALNIPVNAVKGIQALPDVARGLIHEPGATLKGFAQGSSEAATPGRIGLLSLLTGGATIPAALAAAGGEAVAQGTRVATDAPNAPQSFPEAAGNVAEAASVPALAGVLKAVPGAVERAGGTRNVAGRVLGAGFGGYEGYRYGGLPGMVAGAAGGASLGGNGGSRTLRALRSVIGQGATDEAVAAPTARTAPAVPVGAPVAKPDVNWSGVTLSPEAAARNVEATNLRDVSGYSHDVAGRLAGIPGAGKARVTNIPMGEHAITDEMIQNAGGTVTPTPSAVPEPDVTPWSDFTEAAHEAARSGRPIDEVIRERQAYERNAQDRGLSTSPSLRGLQDAVDNTDPLASARDEAVRKYLSDSPNSAFSRLRNAQSRQP